MSAWWSHLSCSEAMFFIGAAYLVIGIAIAVKVSRKARRLNTLTRLGDTPWFRCVYSNYYRAGKLQ